MRYFVEIGDEKINLDNRPEVKYAQKIINGKYHACKWEILSCKRFLNDLKRQNNKTFPYIYDTTRADRFFRFAEKCADVDAPEGSFIHLAEFQYFDCGNIFGWVDKKTGARRFNEALIFEARGQGKSTLSAIIELYVLTADAIYPPYKAREKTYELNPNIVTLAVDRNQTKEVRGTAMEMARRSPEINNEVVVKTTYIKGKRRGGEITAVSKETGNLDGAKLNLIVCDEWAAQKEEQRLNVLRGSFGKRLQCLLIKITTAGSDAMIKPAKTDYDRCVEILSGNIKDERYFIIIRELDEKDDPANFTLYDKQTPILREKNDYSKRLLAQIKDEFNKAFNGGSEQQKIEYLIKRTNRWQVGSEEKFLTQEQLDKLIKSQVPREEFLSMIRGRPCVCGVDASKVVDLTAEAFIFNLNDGKVGIMAQGFMPMDSLQNHLKTDQLPYESYARNNELTLIDGAYIDNQELKQYIVDFETDNDCEIRGICADQAYCYQFLIDCQAGRMPNNKVYETIHCPQTTAVLNEACLNFITWLMADKLVICESELFIKHCANAYTEYDKGGRMKVSKKNHNSYFRIDLLAATLDAIRKIDLLSSENLTNAIESGKFSF